MRPYRPFANEELPQPKLVRLADEPQIELRRAYPRIRDIARVVSYEFNVSAIDILSKRRAATIVLPRQVVMHLARVMTLLSLPIIGRELGGRNHTTVMHGCMKIAKRLERDQNFAARVQAIRNRLTLECMDWRD